MSTPIPPPLRAAAGLAAAAIDSARKVPQQLVGLPVLAISTALQASLKAQQAYAGLVARGDEVLGQLRGQQDTPPWATFDEDDDRPAGPRSAFDAVAETDVDRVAEARAAVDAELAAEAEAAIEEVFAAEALVVEVLAAEAVAAQAEAEAEAQAVAGALAAEAALVEAERAAERAAEVDRALDPDLDPDVLTVAEAAEVEAGFLAEPGLDEAGAGGLDVADLGLSPADGPDPADGSDPADGPGLADGPGPAEGPDLADVVPIGVAGDARPDGSGTEPGADLPVQGAALAADAAATEAALSAGTTVDAPAADGTLPTGTGDGPADVLDGYLAVAPPVPGYDDLSVPQLRGRLRALSLAQVEALLGYERANRSRAPFLTMLENRITTLRSR